MTAQDSSIDLGARTIFRTMDDIFDAWCVPSKAHQTFKNDLLMLLLDGQMSASEVYSETRATFLNIFDQTVKNSDYTPTFLGDHVLSEIQQFIKTVRDNKTYSDVVVLVGCMTHNAIKATGY